MSSPGVAEQSRHRRRADSTNGSLSRLDGPAIIALSRQGVSNRLVSRLLSDPSSRIQRIPLPAETWDHIAKGGWSTEKNRPVGYHWTGLGANSFIQQDPSAGRVNVNNRKAYQTQVMLRPSKKGALETQLRKEGKLANDKSLPADALNKRKTSTFFPDRWREPDLRLSITSATASGASQDYQPQKGAGAGGNMVWNGKEKFVDPMILNTNDESVYPAIKQARS